MLKGVSAARLGEELPSRSGRDEETAGSDGFLLHFNTSGNSSCHDRHIDQVVGVAKGGTRCCTKEIGYVAIHCEI